MFPMGPDHWFIRPLSYRRAMRLQQWLVFQANIYVFSIRAIIPIINKFESVFFTAFNCLQWKSAKIDCDWKIMITKLTVVRRLAENKCLGVRRCDSKICISSKFKLQSSQTNTSSVFDVKFFATSGTVGDGGFCCFGSDWIGFDSDKCSICGFFLGAGWQGWERSLSKLENTIWQSIHCTFIGLACNFMEKIAYFSDK